MEIDDRYNWKDFQPRRRDIAAALAVMLGAALLVGVAGNWWPAGRPGHVVASYGYLQRTALPHAVDSDSAPDAGRDDGGLGNSPGVYKSPQN
jgi:hypothetical protein